MKVGRWTNPLAKNHNIAVPPKHKELWRDFCLYVLDQDCSVTELVTEAINAYEPFCEWRRMLESLGDGSAIPRSHSR
jgi:hypothetical protein